MTIVPTLPALPRETSVLLALEGWFEDFPVGRRMRHARSSTVSETDGSFLAKQVMNTAQGHWNDAIMVGKPLGPIRVSFGLGTAATVFGLASQDCTEHALAELSYDGLRFTGPVHPGDTLEAFTEVVESGPSPDREDAGLVRFKHWGRTHDGRVVFEGERTALVKRRSHWGVTVTDAEE